MFVVLAAGLIAALVAVLLDAAVLEVLAVVLTFYAEHRPIFQAVIFLTLTVALIFGVSVFCQWKRISLIREEKP